MRETLLDYYSKSRGGHYSSPPAPFGSAEPEIMRRGMLTGYVNQNRKRPKGNPAFWYIGLFIVVGIVIGLFPYIGIPLAVIAFVLELTARKTKIPEYK